MKEDSSQLNSGADNLHTPLETLDSLSERDFPTASGVRPVLTDDVFPVCLSFVEPSGEEEQLKKSSNQMLKEPNHIESLSSSSTRIHTDISMATISQPLTRTVSPTPADYCAISITDSNEPIAISKDTRNRCWSHLNRPQRIILWIVVITTLCTSIALLSIFVVTPLVIISSYHYATSVTDYFISNITDEGFSLSRNQIVRMRSPIAATIEPFTLEVGIGDNVMGYVRLSGLDIQPFVTPQWQSQSRFVITNEDLVVSTGRNALDSFANKTFRVFPVYARGQVVIKTLGIVRWTLPYSIDLPFVLGEQPTRKFMEETDSPFSNAPNVRLINTTMEYSLRYIINAEYTSNTSLQIDLGQVACDIKVDGGKPVAQVNVPEASYLRGTHPVSAQIQIVDLSRALFYFLKLVDPVKSAILSIDNIQIFPQGHNVSWIRSWFEGSSFSFPIIRSTFRNIGANKQTQ